MFTGDQVIVLGHKLTVNAVEHVEEGDEGYDVGTRYRGKCTDGYGRPWILKSDGHGYLPEQADDTPIKMVRLWTLFNSPFRLGGDLTEPKGCDWPAGEDVDLGKGFKGVVVYTPKGRTLVVEETSGGIVGNDVYQVKKDIEGADQAAMEKQVENARLTALSMRLIPAEDFWRAYERN